MVTNVLSAYVVFVVVQGVVSPNLVTKNIPRSAQSFFGKKIAALVLISRDYCCATNVACGFVAYLYTHTPAPKRSGDCVTSFFLCSPIEV